MTRSKTDWLPHRMIAPSAVIIVCIILLPLLQGVWMSFQSGALLLANNTRFVGLGNYAGALTKDELFWTSLQHTVIWAVCSVSFAYLIGLALALLLNLDFPGRNVFRALLMLPWVVQNVVIALIWKWMFNDQYGFINEILVKWGITKTRILWLGDPNLALVAVIMVYVWKVYPFMMITLLAALQSIPRELYEAARMDGASIVSCFRYITFPLIRSVSVVVTLLLAIWAFNNFDIIYVLTRGGPGNSTMVMSVMVYFQAFYRMSLGYSSALGVMMLLLLLTMGVLYLRLYRRVDY